jgi:hypothetical protein
MIVTTTFDATGTADGAPPWRDPTLSVADRVQLLLEEMTLEEKVAQLGSRWDGNDMQETGSSGDPDPGLVTGNDASLNVAPMQDVFAASGSVSLEAASRHGLGHLTRVYGSAPVTPVEGAAELVRQQNVVMEASRLRIPALVHEECLTGFTTFGATVYPAAIAWAATFDPDLVERMAAAIGRDMAAVGVHQGLSPVLDVVRDYRWGRVEETMGEDPGCDSRCRLRSRAAGRRRTRHPQTLRRVLRLPSCAQPRAGADGPPRTSGRHPSAVRNRSGAWGRRLGDELLRRRGRSSGGRGQLAAHRPAA